MYAFSSEEAAGSAGSALVAASSQGGNCQSSGSGSAQRCNSATCSNLIFIQKPLVFTNTQTHG